MRASLLARLASAGPLFADASAGGERLVARVRLVLIVCVAPTVLLPGADPLQTRVASRLLLIELVVALALLLAVRFYYRPWLGLVSSALDVSFVSGTLFAFTLAGQPHTAVNSKVVFEVYFLAMICASLRYEWRSTAAAGGLAVLQYAALVTYVATHFDLNAARYAPFTMGTFSWPNQLSRIVLLACAAGASSALVLRAQHLRQLSATDRLTGLWNRGSLDERLAEEWSRSRRHRRPFAVALVDLDRFKQFNDTYGHAAGDEALVAVAETLRHAVRREDVVARYGGEEFVLLLPETDAAGAALRIDELRRQVEASDARPDTQGATGDPSDAVRVTFSAGVAAWPQDGMLASEVLAAADRRLYAAKRAGRNRVVGADLA